MAKYIPAIGLEIHAELKTKTKMFCDSLNDPNESHPNINICPICTGHPGTLPTINKKAVELLLKIGMALNGDIPRSSRFDRKNYFYPDLPKGYQISQYDLPLIFGGNLNGVRIHHIHLEEDAAKLIHQPVRLPDGSTQDVSLVDYNRAGRPLMELVTEPDIKNAEQAVDFVRELRLILRYIGASDADIEKGQMRVDVNVSISYKSNELGTKVEIKNIGSLRALHDAIQYEIKRQADVVSSGGKIKQETRGWDDAKKITVPQRSKEEAKDYRYFPEPDLPPFDLDKFDLTALKLEIPELPAKKRYRFEREYGLTAEKARLLVKDLVMADYFESAVSELLADLGAADAARLRQEAITLVFNYLTTDLKGLLAEHELELGDVMQTTITPENFADLIQLILDRKILSRGAKDVLRSMLKTGLDPNQIIEQEGLEAVSDENQLEETVKKVIENNPKAVADYRRGKKNAVQFLVGKAMAELRGKGDPQLLRELIERYLQ